MHVITLAPIVRASASTLSYFSPISYPKGAVIQVPVRSKTHDAVVLDSEPAAALKTELRNADYTLRKIPETTPKYATNLLFLQALSEISEHTTAGMGALLKTALPQVAFQTLEEKEPKVSRGDQFEYQYFQNLSGARREFFKNHIRASFADGRSIFILAPTSQKVEQLGMTLSRGIGKHTFILHGKLSAKRKRDVWNAAREHEHPALIISTPHFLALPRKDLGTIILEDEGSDMYEARERPFLDFRHLAREYARLLKIKCIAADTLVRAEVVEETTPSDGSRSVYPSATSSSIIDMNTYTTEGEGFRIFSPEVENVLKKSNKEKIILYVTRRGTYPLTQCNDCGTIVKCKKCNYPLVLYEKKGKNTYRCHMCNRTYGTDIRCHNCHGWRLSLYGIGHDRVRQEVEKYVPDSPLFVLDEKPEEKKALVEKFEAEKSGILITLSSGLEYITTAVDTVAVISIDPLFAIPDIGISEKIARLLLELRARAQKKFLIQTRNADEAVLEYVQRGDLTGFSENELADRKKFNLPPYTRFIKLRWSGRGATGVEKKVRRILEPYSPDIYSSFYRTPKGARIYNALISLDRDKWPDEDLAQRLKGLPRSVGVNVDPVSII